ncbi:MAG: M67 family metallopeptidase [Acidobacteria bacterium]|nr:M67 family metallopeptidase [Acidobacteriota bacterium]
MANKKGKSSVSELCIRPDAWAVMLEHSRSAYPEECCGAMLGQDREVREAVPLTNSFAGSRRNRYEIRPEELLAATRAARDRGLRILGIYHSHPGRDAHFSAADLKNSCPWYCFLVLSMRRGEFHHAACWRPNTAQTAAEEIGYRLLEA